MTRSILKRNQAIIIFKSMFHRRHRRSKVYLFYNRLLDTEQRHIRLRPFIETFSLQVRLFHAYLIRQNPDWLTLITSIRQLTLLLHRRRHTVLNSNSKLFVLLHKIFVVFLILQMFNGNTDFLHNVLDNLSYGTNGSGERVCIGKGDGWMVQSYSSCVCITPIAVQIGEFSERGKVLTDPFTSGSFHYFYRIIKQCHLLPQIIMNNKSYLTTNPELYKKTAESTTKSTPPAQLNLQEMAATFIAQQQVKIKQLQVQIHAYEVQIEAERKNKVDHGPYIDSVERDIAAIRNEQTYINEQIRNCQLVEGQVTPMEYYLWKKKQRINTYDASIAEVCHQIQLQRQELEKTMSQQKIEEEELNHEIEQLEEKITQLNASSNTLHQQHSQEDAAFEELFTANIKIREECKTLAKTKEILQENKDIVSTQIKDNISSIESSIKTYFDSEKTKLVKELKQIQLDSKSIQISQLTTEEQNYKIDPLLSDYNNKLKELLSAAPQNMKKVVMSILQPLSWQKFYWRDFLSVEPKSEQIYTEYKKLQAEYMQNQNATTKIIQEIKQISNQLATEQQKSTDLAENIRKVKKRIKK